MQYFEVHGEAMMRVWQGLKAIDFATWSYYELCTASNPDLRDSSSFSGVNTSWSSSGLNVISRSSTIAPADLLPRVHMCDKHVSIVATLYIYMCVCVCKGAPSLCVNERTYTVVMKLK